MTPLEKIVVVPNVKAIFAVLLACFLAIGCGRKGEYSLKDDLPVSEYNEAEMKSAIAAAKGRVDEFIKVLEFNGADRFFVKVPIKEGDRTEHFWIDEVLYRDGFFIGHISNKPGVVKKVKLGQRLEVKRDEISDWMYYSGDKIYGGFTIDPLLSTFPKEEAEILRAKLVR